MSAAAMAIAANISFMVAGAARSTHSNPGYLNRKGGTR